MDEVATNEQAGTEEPEAGGNAAPAPAVPVARCLYCGEGMFSEVWPRFSRGFGIVVLIVGLLVSIFLSILLGLPVVVLGTYIWIASRNVWVCRECGSVVDRA
jgi:ABC-type phosphate transport system permease subunit